MKRTVLFAIIVLIVAIPTFANTKTSNVVVSATVSKGCTITAAPVAFGAYDPTGATIHQNGGVSVQCTKGTTWSVALDGGANVSGAIRRMKDAVSGDFLPYELYSEGTWTTVWNATTPVTGAGTGAAQANTVYGALATGQFVTPGTYGDTVVATITY